MKRRSKSNTPDLKWHAADFVERMKPLLAREDATAADRNYEHFIVFGNVAIKHVTVAPNEKKSRK